MKRFIITNLLSAVAIGMMACSWVDTHNYYLFSVCSHEEFSDRCNKLTLQNWRAYMGLDEEYYYFDADQVVESAQRQGDALMVSYVRQLQKYLKCASEAQQDTWDYPTKAQLADRNRRLLAIRSYAQGKLKTRLRSQHALLLMRCNMMLGRHSENVRLWEGTTSNFINSVYKDMMKNIYAGALLKTGQPDRAAALFAEMGDWASLMTMYYERRSYAAIRAEYERDANSAVLPFLLQDFVNNAQEAVDGKNDEWGFGGKLFIRDIQESEARQMCEFAKQVVKEGKTQTPQLWQMAKAWLEYLFGNKKQALTDINAAATLAGTPRMNDNARVLRLYITSSQLDADRQYDDYLAGELTWLGEKKQEDGFFRNAYDRMVHQVLADQYLRANRPEVAVALYNIDESYEYQCFIDTTAVEGLKQFINYAKSPAATPLESYLKKNLTIDDMAMNDLVGTKLMRLCKWSEALEWLEKVPLSYYNEKSYRPYATRRTWSVEPWLKRQWLKDAEAYGEEQPLLTQNPKVAFIREMLELENGLSLLQGESRCQHCFALAVRYAQAHFTGDCWFLMRDGKSVTDTLRVNEADLAGRALSLLREAAGSSDAMLRERALFAMSYGGLYPEKDQWSVYEWNEAEVEYQKIAKPQTSQYQAFRALAAFEAQNTQGASRYVSRCDEYRQFRKQAE
jgi:hypothetical protein